MKTILLDYYKIHPEVLREVASSCQHKVLYWLLSVSFNGYNLIFHYNWKSKLYTCYCTSKFCPEGSNGTRGACVVSVHHPHLGLIVLKTQESCQSILVRLGGSFFASLVAEHEFAHWDLSLLECLCFFTSDPVLYLWQRKEQCDFLDYFVNVHISAKSQNTCIFFNRIVNIIVHW